jgi:hypothetical protein
MLVRATTAPDAVVDFPAAEDAQRPGWDGRVDNPKRNTYVPAGNSGWELSTEVNPQIKADRDYQKRKDDPLGLDPKGTTFIAVSARKWGQKRQWAAAKKEEGFWSSIVAYDAIDLEQWLELCPEVAIWFATHIGRRPHGVQSLEDFWNEFCHSTAPTMTPALLLAGRKNEAEKVTHWLESGSGVFRILADSADEALAFVSAVSVMSQNTNRQHKFAETIVATDAEQIRQLIGASHQLTFGWRLDDPSLLGTIVNKGHRALIPLGRSAALVEHADIELPRLGRAEFVAAIKDALSGEPGEKQDQQREDEADRRARKCGRSITVYRRLFASAGVVQPPAWATPERAQELVPVVLAGSWSESNDADRVALSKLAGIDYEAVSKTVMRWKNQPDAPIRRIGDTWTLIAPLDAWSLLGRFISDTDLERFSQTVHVVLGETDPKLQLAPNERWLADLHGKEFRYSTAIRRGLAESLILLAVVGDEARVNASQATAHFSHRLVTKLLGGKSDAKRWASLSELLPQLAEAAPEAFLDALEEDLCQDAPDVLCLFEAEERPLGGGDRYTYILWALETLAWYPAHLSQVALILAKLERLAPETKIVNSPHNSLCEVFCMWHRNTAATLDERLQALDRLLKREPDVAWNLLLELLPKYHDVSGNTAGPRWRVKPDITSVTYGEAWRAHEELVHRALSFADLDGRRLSKLVSRIASWSPEQRQLFLGHIQRFSDTSKDVAARTQLWQEVRDFVSSHRTYRDAEWALPETELVPFDAVLNSLKPSDIWESNLWLFNEHFPELPNPKTTSVEGREKEVAEVRQNVVATMLQQRGLDSLLVLARRAKLPWLLGISIAEVVTDTNIEREILERALAAEEPGDRALGRAYVVRRQGIKGHEWSEDLLKSALFTTWSDAKQAEFCLCLPEVRSTWQLVSSLGVAVEERYWAKAQVFLSRLESEDDAEIAVEKLLMSDRALYALDQAAFQPSKLSVNTLIRILECAVRELARADKPFAGANLAYELGRIFDRLRASGEVSDTVLGRLEWQYLPLLRFREKPVTLHRLLQRDPQLFATLIEYAFKSEGDEENPASRSETSETEKRNRARLAWDLLESWKTPPGYRPDGAFNPVELIDWVRGARSLCSARQRSAIGDDRIGHVLAHAPPDSDGVWPHTGVRDVIEETESRHLESGLHAGRINQRGVSCKNPLEGGRQERELEKQYRNWAKAVTAKWPRTARLLNSLAETYESFGRMEDVSAERIDLE